MTELILASGSAARRRMLADAGVSFTVHTAEVDEVALRALLAAQNADTERAAVAVAEAKAAAVAVAHPAAIVLGADQILDHDGHWLDKPRDRAAARDQLAALRGSRHALVSGVVAWRGGGRIWQTVDRAALTVRPFSDAFLEDYLDRADEALTACVGAYQLEGLGAQLFAEVRGDFFTVLGMPLLPVLDFLRREGVLVT